MNSLPLEGYRILDFSTAWAGTMCGHLLADWGAEVIKVESRTKLDGLRKGRPLVSDDIAGGDRGDWPELQPLFHCLNRNKLGITVDFKNPKGLQLLKRLIAKTDALTYNYSPGVMERAGLGWQELTKIKHDIIMVSMPVAGESGPWKDVVGYAYGVLALSGLSSVLGYEDDSRPLGMGGIAYCDTVTGIHGAISTCLALYHRNITGEGQYVEMSQWEAATAMFIQGIMELQMTDRTLKPQGNSHPIMAPHGNYPCSGEDKWVSIAIGNQEEWEAFCNAASNPAWTREPRFGDQYLRQRNHTELDKLVAAWTCQHTDEEITSLLQSVGVPAMKLNTIETSYFDPHHQTRKIYQEVDLPRPEHVALGTETLPAFAWKMTDAEPKLHKAAPVLGESNEYVFGELLGLPRDEVKRLEEEKVLY